MEKVNDMPWLSDAVKFPRVFDEGFDDFSGFTPLQVEIIHAETREETALEVASGIIRALAKLDLDSDRDFLMAVQSAADQVI